jgi:acetyl-CoA carboxylase carboxyl transferase subunit alpha
LAEKKKSSESTAREAGTSGGASLPFERPIQEYEEKIAALEALALNTRLDISGEIKSLRTRMEEKLRDTYSRLSAWERVTVARHPRRPITADYVATLLDDFHELHGDRYFGDDPAILTGFATMGGRRFLLVGNRKGRTTKERLVCNFGCAHPEGYRKALRKMKLAERLGLPIVSLINTPGAYPGIGAEERGQAMAIAENILAMVSLRVPIVVVVIGEGGSGGALGIGVGDRVLMLEYSYYSVISPEGCAAILWKDAERTPEAAEALKLTAPDLKALGIIDRILPEPLGGAHRAPEQAMETVKQAIVETLDELCAQPLEQLLAQRLEKFRRIGELPGRFPHVEAR